MEINMRSLIINQRIRNISCEDMDKSSEIQIKMPGNLKLVFTQELYTYFLRCSDLNLTYQDSLQPSFDTFRLFPDYFNLSEPLALPKMRIHLTIPDSLSVSLCSSPADTTTLVMNDSHIQVDMLLD